MLSTVLTSLFHHHHHSYHVEDHDLSSSSSSSLLSIIIYHYYYYHHHLSSIIIIIHLLLPSTSIDYPITLMVIQLGNSNLSVVNDILQSIQSTISSIERENCTMRFIQCIKVYAIEYNPGKVYMDTNEW